MILAAGLGTRMRPLTLYCPKPLLDVAGESLIVRQIKRLAASGVREIVINHSWLGEMIVEALGDGAHLGVSITYSAEEAVLETGGGVYQALPSLGDEPFLLVNGDVFCECPLDELSLSPGDLAELVLVPNPAQHPDGDFVFTGGRVFDQGEGPRYTFSGISILHPQLFKDCRPGVFPLAPLLRSAMADGRVGGRLYSGYWQDVGNRERLRALERHLLGLPANESED